MKMNKLKKTFTHEFGGKDIVIETGWMAKQADGAIWITSGGTQVLVTVVSAKEINEGQDFFPLLVDYKERFYAGGKFLGGFSKREGRPSNAEILLMRMVDRPFRPLFPEGYMAETIITATVHSYDSSADPEVLAGLGASAALTISDIPFSGPVGFCKVGRIDGNFVLNPAHADWKTSDIEMVVAGTKDAISMIEGEVSELSEDLVLKAIMFGHDHIKKWCDFLAEVAKEVGKEKRIFVPVGPGEILVKKIEKDFSQEAKKCLDVQVKQDRQNSTVALEQKVAADMEANPKDYGLEEGAGFKKLSKAAVDSLMYKMMRGEILF